MDNFNEKRKYKRIRKEIEVNCQNIDVEDELDDMFKNVKGTSKDISRGGMQIVLNTPLKIGEKIKLKFTIEDSEQIFILGEVRWCDFDYNIGKYRTGIKFLYTGENIESIIKQLEQDG